MPVRSRSSREGRGEDARERAELVTVLAGRGFVGGKLQPVEIGIDDAGRIARVARSISGGDRHDLGEAVIMPAATDLHVHFREPALPQGIESYRDGTEAAALGGVGLVADMPNGDPPATTVDRLRAKAVAARGRLAVDLLLYAGLAEGVDVERLARDAGAWKLYLSPTTGVEQPPAPESVRPLLERAAATGLPVTVHAEDPARFRELAPPGDLEGWDRSRPAAAELAGVERLLPIPPSLRLHVAHVTTEAVAARLTQAGASFEVAPHHLLLSIRGLADARRKVNPPLRADGERARLWERFRSGGVPIVASDHAPHPIADKERPFALAPSGVPGVETMLPLLLAKVRSGDLPFPTLLRAACDRPARWVGAPIGRLAPGHRANLLAVDFRDRRTIRGETLRTRCKWTPFEGWDAIFPRFHWRDGIPLVEEGEFVGRRDGTVVRPEYAPAA